jgi:hypothetical protein
MPFPLRLSFLLGVCLFLASSEKSAQLPETSGIKITMQFVSGETSSEDTTFIQSGRGRMEYRSALGAVHGDGTLDTRPGPLLALITRCDLGKTFELNLEDREYLAAPYPRFKLTKHQIEARTDNILQKVAPWVPTVREETTTVDTGEKKNFFGHEARHVIKTQKTIPLAGSHSEPQEWVTDGWYIDLDTSISCDVKWQPHNVNPRHEYYAVGGERYEIIDDGIRIIGFAIEQRHTSHSSVTLPDGTKRPTVYTNEEKITEFYEGPLDAALFEVPPSFRKVSDLRRTPPITLSDRWYLTRGWMMGLAHDLFK